MAYYNRSLAMSRTVTRSEAIRQLRTLEEGNAERMNYGLMDNDELLEELCLSGIYHDEDIDAVVNDKRGNETLPTKTITRSEALRQLNEIQDDIEYMENEEPFDFYAMTNEELLAAIDEWNVYEQKNIDNVVDD